MADTNTRQGKRTPVTLKIKFKSETLEQFIERYAVDVSQGGIFIRTKEPLAVGTQMKFEFQLKDASPLIAGEGTVVWTRENDPSRPAIAPGMGVRFDRLADGSQTVLEKILSEKAKQAPTRSGNVTAPGDSNKAAAMFTDTPTRVAPAPVQEALGLRSRAESEQTPLPKPVPFHSDADDFDEKAFEEATKVRSLDELAAQSASLDNGLDDVANQTKIMPADELAIRRQEVRADSTLSDPPLAEPPSDDDKEPDESDMSALNEGPATKSIPDRESAPALPSAPAVTPARARTPTPSGAAPAPVQPARSASTSIPPANAVSDSAQSNATKLGMEPAKAVTSGVRTAAPSSAPPVERAERSAAKPTAPASGSKAPLVIGIALALVAAAAAVYFLAIKKEPASTDSTGSGSAVVNTGSGSAITPDIGSGSAIATSGSGSSEGSATGSDGATGSGSATAMTGSGAGSAAPAAPLADTTVTATAKGALVEITGTDHKGKAPFTAKLEKGKMFRAHVSAPGFASSDVDVKGGDRTSVNLARKPHIVTVNTDPPGAAIYIDNADTGKLTPADVELTAAQAARPRIRLSLRRSGFRPLDQVLDANAWKESDARMTATVEGKLVQAQQVVRPPANPANGNGAGSASVPPPTGTGTGSAATPTGAGSASTTTTPTTSPAGTGSATTTPPPAPTPPPPAPSAGSASGTPSGGQELK